MIDRELRDLHELLTAALWYLDQEPPRVPDALRELQAAIATIELHQEARPSLIAE